MIFKRRDKRVRRRLRKFKNATFDYSKYVKDFYVEDGMAYISVKVKSKEDIMSRFSIKDYAWINEEFANYIEQNSYYIPVEYPIVVEICGCHFNEEEQQQITRVIKDYFGLKLGDKQIDLDMNAQKALILLIFGIISCGLAFYLMTLNVFEMMLEIGLILLWFFLWEFADLAWLDRYDLLIQKLEAGQLASLKVIFNENEK